METILTLNLNTLDKVKEFTNEANKYRHNS